MPYSAMVHGQIVIGSGDKAIPIPVTAKLPPDKPGTFVFDYTADLRSRGPVALAGRNASPLPLEDALSHVLDLNGSALDLPSDFPALYFERDALEIAVSSGVVSLRGAAAAEWKDPFGVLKG